MEIDAELRRQIAVSLLAAAVFVVGLVGIGVTFGGSSELPEAGAIALVGLLAGFVLLMALVGAYLIRANDAE
jgi:ABC-type Co2+ transport system permease subunit